MSIFYNAFLKYKWKLVFAIFVIMSSCILISALFIDYYLGFDSCELCIYERIPYVVILLTSIASYFVVNHRFRTFTLYIIGFTIFIGLSIAIYHTGIELNWWSPTTKCTPQIVIKDDTTYDDFMHQINEAKVGDCTKAAFKIMGLSLAEINIVVNLILLIIIVKLIKFNAKTKV